MPRHAAPSGKAAARAAERHRHAARADARAGRGEAARSQHEGPAPGAHHAGTIALAGADDRLCTRDAERADDGVSPATRWRPSQGASKRRAAASRRRATRRRRRAAPPPRKADRATSGWRPFPRATPMRSCSWSRHSPRRSRSSPCRSTRSAPVRAIVVGAPAGWPRRGNHGGAGGAADASGRTGARRA